MLEEWMDIVQNDYPGTFGDEQEWHPFYRLISVPRSHLKIHTTPPRGHSAYSPAFKPIMVVTMRRVAQTFNCVSDKVKYGTKFKLVNLSKGEDGNLTQEDPNTRFDEPDNRFNIHLVQYNTSASRINSSSNGQHSYGTWSFRILDDSRR